MTLRLTAIGASPQQIAEGEAAARAYLDSRGITMDHVSWAWAIYEHWVEGCAGPDDMPPDEGADIREAWGEAQRIAYETVSPHLKGYDLYPGGYRLEWDAGPSSAVADFGRFDTGGPTPF